jgi:dCMP deaminase
MSEFGNKERLNWNDYFMSHAILAAMRSDDPSTQVGCVLVKQKAMKGMGYNGYPKGVEPFTWERDPKADFMESKYTYIVHSEVNAVINTSREDCFGAKAYVTLFPCNVCAGIMISVGIREIIYLDDKYHDMPFSKAARMLFRAARVPFRQYDGSIEKLWVEKKSLATFEGGLG